MSFSQLIFGILFCAFLVWNGRRVARTPDRFMYKSDPMHTGMASIFPVRTWSIRILRGLAIFSIWLGLFGMIAAVADGFHPAGMTLYTMAIVAIIFTFFLIPKQQTRTVPDAPWRWQRRRPKREI